MDNCRYSQTLERIVPDELIRDEITGRRTLQLHLKRYQYATKFVSGKVLDAACGVGYGSAILATMPKVEAVVGIDVEKAAVAYAKLRYNHRKADFYCTDVYDYNPVTRFDCIVSLETLEHLSYPKLALLHFNKLLHPTGVLIASVPITPSVDANPHHLSDFDEQSFKQLLQATGFRVEDEYVQVQSYRLWAIWKKSEVRTQNLRPNLLRWYLQHPAKFWLRLKSLLTDGFQNRYLTVKARKVSVHGVNSSRPAE